MTETEKLAAELVSNFSRPATLKTRQKRADFVNNVRTLLSGAGSQAVDYLRDPNNVTARNALIGAGIGGVAGGVGSVGGRRIRDTIRGALLGGTVGGAGTLAYKGLHGAAKNMTTPAIPKEVQGLDVTQPDWFDSVAEARPVTGATAAGLLGMMARNNRLAGQPETLSTRLSRGGFKTLGAAFPAKDVDTRHINRVLGRFNNELESARKPSGWLSRIPGADKAVPLDEGQEAFAKLMAKDRRGAYEMLREAVNEMQSGNAGAPTAVPVADDLIERIKSQKDAVRGHTTNPAASGPAGPAIRQGRFYDLRDEMVKHLDDKAGPAMARLTPEQLDSVGGHNLRRPRRLTLGRNVGLGAAGILGGLMFEPQILRTLRGGLDYLGRPNKLSPEEVKRLADLVESRRN